MDYTISEVTNKDLEELIEFAKKEGFKVTSKRDGFFRIYAKSKKDDGWDITKVLKTHPKAKFFVPSIYGEYVEYEWPRSVSGEFKYLKPDDKPMNESIEDECMEKLITKCICESAISKAANHTMMI